MASKHYMAILLISVSLVMVGTLAVSGFLTASKAISNRGSIKAAGVEVYSDAACSQVLSSIDWGMLDPGGSVTRTIYVKNIGNAAVTLKMYASDWSPSNAGSYITISWDKGGVKLSSGSSTSAVLTLSVSSSITNITSFSVNIIIQGTT